MSDWSSYRISNIGKVVTGNTPSKNNPNDFGFEMPFITPSDYGNYRKYANSSIRYLSIDGIERLNNKIVPKKSILVTCIGSDMGKVVMNKIDIITNQQINSIIPNNDIVNSDYLYYLIKNSHEYLQLLGSDGTAVPIVNKSTFENIEINLPPLPEQKAIASVLSSLDDKIDLLHRQNETLEKMAETLFRKWFVEDAKEDWENVKLGDLVKINGGFSYKGENINKGESFLLGMGCVSNSERFLLSGVRSYSGECNEKYLVKPGDLVIATRQQSDNLPILGFPAIIPQDLYGKKVIVGANLYRVENISEINNYLIYLILRTKEYKNHIISSSKGSTVRMITKDAIESYEIKIPSRNKIHELEDIINPINTKTISNISQIQSLTKLRDTLLPKLMSGEVRVKLD